MRGTPDKKVKRLTYLLGVAAVCGGVAWAAVDATSGGDRHPPAAVASQGSRSKCPQHVLKRPSRLDDVVAAARRIVIRGQTIRSQGRSYRLTAENTPIIEVVRLVPPAGADLPGAATLRRLARTTCPRTVVANSWAIVIEYPLAQIARTNRAIVFVTRTEDGWQTYSAGR